MIKAAEVQKVANLAGIRDTQAEKDYVISWALVGIAKNETLNDRLLFKGGTSLKKIYFSEYRFSEDLDFTYTEQSAAVESLLDAWRSVNEWIFGESRIKLEIGDVSKSATGSFTFYLAYTGPLGSAREKSIKVDISTSELVVDSPVSKPLILPYSDLHEMSYDLRCYSLQEIAAEKLRSLIQRTAPRDIYDLWYLFQERGQDILDSAHSFRAKTLFKKLDPTRLLEIVGSKEKKFESQWNTSLKDQIKDVPEFDGVWRNLQKHIRNLFGSGML